jgi:hypothetical protein
MVDSAQVRGDEWPCPDSTIALNLTLTKSLK